MPVIAAGDRQPSQMVTNIAIRARNVVFFAKSCPDGPSIPPSVDHSENGLSVLTGTLVGMLVEA